MLTNEAIYERLKEFESLLKKELFEIKQKLATHEMTLIEHRTMFYTQREVAIKLRMSEGRFIRYYILTDDPQYKIEVHRRADGKVLIPAEEYQRICEISRKIVVRVKRNRGQK